MCHSNNILGPLQWSDKMTPPTSSGPLPTCVPKQSMGPFWKAKLSQWGEQETLLSAESAKCMPQALTLWPNDGFIKRKIKERGNRGQTCWRYSGSSEVRPPIAKHCQAHVLVFPECISWQKHHPPVHLRQDLPAGLVVQQALIENLAASVGCWKTLPEVFPERKHRLLALSVQRHGVKEKRQGLWLRSLPDSTNTISLQGQTLCMIRTLCTVAWKDDRYSEKNNEPCPKSHLFMTFHGYG